MMDCPGEARCQTVRPNQAARKGAVAVYRFRWRRFSGWWLVAGAALLAAVLTAVSKLWPGTVGSVLVAAVSVVAVALSDRGSAKLAADSGEAGRDDPMLRVQHGRLVRQIVDPVQVGVYPAAYPDSGATGSYTPPFIPRDQSAALEAAVQSGRFVLVTGESTAGKSRAAYEAMRARVPDHVFVRPLDRAGLRAAVAVVEKQRRCVVWLDDLPGYLGDGGLSVHLLDRLLGDGSRDVLVLATMRVQERSQYETAGPGDPSGAELPRMRREVLDRAVEIRIDREWTSAELTRAAAFADDARIAAALEHSAEFGVAEYLAAGPKLLTTWRDGWAPGSHPRGAAVVAAAVDARRAGFFDGLPPELLRTLHDYYLQERGGVRLRPESWDDAFAWATQARYATSGLLVPTDLDHYVVFDYLPDAVDAAPDAAPIPEATWRLLIADASPAQAADLGWAAFEWHRDYEQARSAYSKSIREGHLTAAVGLAQVLGNVFGDDPAAIDVLRRALDRASAQRQALDPDDLLTLRQALSWHLGQSGDMTAALQMARQVADDATDLLGPRHLETILAQINLARWVGANGDPQSALEIARQAEADGMQSFGTTHRVMMTCRFEVAVWTGKSGDPRGAVRLWQELDADATSAFPADLELIMDSRRNLAYGMFLADNPAHGLPYLESVVSDHQQLLGADNHRTLAARTALAHALGQNGRHREALLLAHEVAAACATHLPSAHETALNSRFEVALWTSVTGASANASALFQALRDDAVHAYGPGHPLVTDCDRQLQAPGAATSSWLRLERW
jgi:hypothetical protein